MALKEVWSRTRPLDRLLVILLLTLCALLFVLLRPGATGRRVIVEQDGRVVFTAPLDQDRTVAIAGPLGDTRIEIGHGSACVLDSPCPHKVCIGMGRIARGGELLACVPNGLLLRIEGSADGPGEAPAYDLLSR